MKKFSARTGFWRLYASAPNLGGLLAEEEGINVARFELQARVTFHRIGENVIKEAANLIN